MSDTLIYKYRLQDRIIRSIINDNSTGIIVSYANTELEKINKNLKVTSIRVLKDIENLSYVLTFIIKDTIEPKEKLVLKLKYSSLFESLIENAIKTALSEFITKNCYIEDL